MLKPRNPAPARRGLWRALVLIGALLTLGCSGTPDPVGPNGLQDTTSDNSEPSKPKVPPERAIKLFGEVAATIESGEANPNALIPQARRGGQDRPRLR